MGGIEGAAAGA
jgi:hypothetical protein